MKRVFHGGATAAAVVAQYSFFQFRNDAADNKMMRLLSGSLSSNVSGQVVGLYVGALAAWLAGGNGMSVYGTGFEADPEYGSSAAYFPGLSVVASTYVQLDNQFELIKQPLIIKPGDMIALGCSSTNTTLRAGFVWEETDL